MDSTTVIILLTAAILAVLLGIWGWLHEAHARMRALRTILPMSTGVPILPTQSAQITGRPREAFKPDRIFISELGASPGSTGGSADWVVNDIKIAGQSIFLQSGDVPGDMFATKAIDNSLSFGVIQPWQELTIIVTYVGPNDKGMPFFASVMGTLEKPSKRQQDRDRGRRGNPVAARAVS